MLAKIHSVGLAGIEGFPVEVQVDESDGLPRSVVVGNVSGSVREALERCSVALKNQGIFLPPKRLTVNLQPADKRKDGTGFDLPILVGMMKALGLISLQDFSRTGFVGEVGLDGQILPIRGVLSLVMEMKKTGLQSAVVPMKNVREALSITDMDIIAVRSLRDVLKLLSSQEAFDSFERPHLEKDEEEQETILDFSDIHGQDYAVRAALISACGSHNMLLSGTAGSGKTMIARRIPGILPTLTRQESIEITRIYSVAGLLKPQSSLIHDRPFRTPHHTITTQALIGGSSQGGIMPGELALAEHGVIFLDELPLFSKSSIEALRQPMEEKRVVINRLSGSFIYPADCLIVAAMNPCPCGYYPDRSRCQCTPGQIRAYQRGISKPILERIDLCVEANPVSFEDAIAQKPGISSSELRKQVTAAREIQAERFRNSPTTSFNSEMNVREIEQFCPLGSEEQEFMSSIFTLKKLSMRTFHKILKVARTIADLEGCEQIRTSHLAEAVSYRGIEDQLYGENGYSGMKESPFGSQKNEKIHEALINKRVERLFRKREQDRKNISENVPTKDPMRKKDSSLFQEVQEEPSGSVLTFDGREMQEAGL